MSKLLSTLLKRSTLVTMSFVLAVSSLSAAMPLFLSQTASAAPVSEIVYNGIPAVQPGSYPSLGYQATSTKEFGDEIQLAGTNRHLNSVTVSLTDWACETDSPCVTTPDATFNHDITLNLYAVSAGVVGAQIASKTQTFAVPYRPSADDINCLGPDAGKWYDGTKCNSGYAFDVNFDFSADAAMLPNDLVATVAYNTQSYGSPALGVAGPYNSLNVSLAQSAPTTGIDVDSDVMFWNTTYPGYTGGLIADTDWTPYHLAIRINATELAAPTNLAPANNSATNDSSFDNTWDAVPGAVKYEYTTDYQLGGSSHTYADTSDSSNYVLGGSTIIRHNSGAPESTYVWKVRAVDAYGNVSAWSEPSSVTVDHTAPVAPVNGQPTVTSANPFYFTWGAVTDAGSPIVEYQFQSSGSSATSGGSLIGAWQNWVSGSAEQLHLTTPTIHSTGAADGTYYWQVRAIDAAGNVGAWSTVWSTDIDTTAPAVPVLNFPSDNVYRHSANTNHSDWSAVADTHGPVTYIYQSAYDAGFTDVAYTSASLTANTILNTGEPEITYFWHVKACDALGNCSDWSTPRTINIDNTVPVVTVSPLIISDNTPNLSGTISEPTATVKIKVNGHTYTATNHGDGTWTVNASHYLSDGIYNVKATATDLANNVGTDSTTNELTVDATKPQIKNISLSDSIINALDVNPVLTATLKDLTTGITGAQYKIVGQTGWISIPASDTSYDSMVESINETIDVSAITTDGTYTLKLRTYDMAGNSLTRSITFTIDRTAPVVDITNALDGITVGHNASVTITGSTGDAASYTLSVGGGAPVDTGASFTSYNWDTTGLVSGAYVITLKGIDAAGNPASDSVTITVDNTAPALTVGSYTGTSLTPTLTGTTDNAGDKVTVDGTIATVNPTVNGTGTYDWAFTFPTQAIGSHSANVISTDAFGNSTSETATVTVNSVPATETTPASTNTTITPTGTTTTNTADQGVLGAQDSKDNIAKTDNTSTPVASVLGDATSKGPMSIFGLAWYWWILIAAAIASTWWFIARRRGGTDGTV